MKKILLLLVFLCGLGTQAYTQNEIYLNFTKEYKMVWDDQLQDSVRVAYYISRDTLGDPVNNSYDVEVRQYDSTYFVQVIQDRIEVQYSRTGDAGIAYEESRYLGNRLKNKLAEVTGVNDYQARMNDKYRPSFTGNWTYRRGGQDFSLTADGSGNFDDGAVLRLRLFPQSYTWIGVIDQTDSELIELYRYNDALWVGRDSNESRVFLSREE
jgi:hypothetical protein